ASGFMRQAAVTKRAMAVPTALAEYPGVIPTDTEEEYDTKVTTAVVPAVGGGVAARLTGKVSDDAGPGEPEPPPVLCSGSLDEVQEYFEERLWTDGLPIVPPTRDRIDEFLRWTPHAPDEVLGVLAPELREATVWSIAVNGVMAGCRPEYMPVLVAAVQAI